MEARELIACWDGRHEAALARLPRPEPEPDFADALAERVSAPDANVEATAAARALSR